MENPSSMFSAQTPITTIVTLLILLIVYFVLFKVGAYVITAAFADSKSPYIFRGKIDANRNLNTTILTNPNVNVKLNGEATETRKVIPIYRSENESGIEFTWMVWIFIDSNSAYSTTSWAMGDKSRKHLMHIFNKGSKPGQHSNDSADLDEMPYKDTAQMSCPGLYLEHNQNIDESDQSSESTQNFFNLRFDINTHDPKSMYETLRIPNVPLNKWIHVVVRVVDNLLDVYINGKIKRRHELNYLPLQNYGDIHLLSANSPAAFPFTGHLSDLRYFNYGLQARTIEHFTEKGPNLTESEDLESSVEATPYYLTQRWYYNDYLHQ
jgi:hypothetical protein